MLLKFQRVYLSAVIEIVMGHCIMGVHVRRIAVERPANDCCRSCRDDEKEETELCPALCQRRRRYLDAYNIDDLSGLLKFDVGSLSRFIFGARWFED